MQFASAKLNLSKLTVALYHVFTTNSHLLPFEVSAGMILLLAPHLLQHRLPLLTSSLLLAIPLPFLPPLPRQP